MISYFINSIEGLLTGSIPVNSIDCENTTPTSGSFSVRGTLDPNNSDILLVKENKTTKTAGVQSGTSVVVAGSGKITNDDYQLLMKTLSQGRSLSKTQFESTNDFIIWKIPFSNGFLTYCHFYRLNAHRYYVFASQKNYSLSDLSACLDSKGVGYTDVIRINAGSPVQNTGVGDSIGCCFFSESYTPFDRSMLRFGGVYTYSISNDKVILSWTDSAIGLPFNEFLDTLNIGDPEIEEKDERKQLIRSKAQAISGEILHWLLMAGAWVCIFFDAPLWIVLTLVGAFLLKTILDFILMAYYQHKM